MPAPPVPVHIALLDDHALFRQGMRFILQSLPYPVTVTEAATLPELLPLFRRQLPDILLLDLQMPDLDGTEAAQQLLAEFPELKIVVLSMFSAENFVLQMMRLGARSYLPKDSTSEELILAIEEVLATGYHFTLPIARALMRDGQPPQPAANQLPNQLRLTQREQQVLALICEGHTALDIAERLFISPRTVEGHRQKLLDKTGAGNVAGLVAFAAKHGLLR